VRFELIAIDWGTSHARAYWLDAHGEVKHETSAPLGVLNVPAGGFAAALAALLAAGPDDRAPMLACGMIGSRQGWIDAPYCECPADAEALASALTVVPGTRLAIVPGLICRDPDAIPDVMRGEETQILGALEDGASSSPVQVLVLPGTHSKWAIVREARIETFATFMTGELYAVLREHSILGRMATTGDDPAAAEAGIRRSLATNADLTHDLFSARTLAVCGELAPGAVGDYLSGLLLGAELAAGRRWFQRQRALGESVLLIGDAGLCERYRRAFAIAGLEATIGPPHAAARGLWRLARRARIVGRGSP
jgi:2-dehydro-3-deoxygalactonokinase